MVRNIFGVIVGYLSMFVFIFISFTVLYMILGAEGSFQPGSYQVSTVWIVASIVLGILAAILGGYICVMIAKNKKAAMWLAGLVLVLGIIFAIPSFNLSEEELNKVRDSDVSNMEAMENAKTPPLMAVLQALIGAAGVVAGSRLRKES